MRNNTENCKEFSFHNETLNFSNFVAGEHEHSTAYYWKEFCAGSPHDTNGNSLVDEGGDTCAGKF